MPVFAAYRRGGPKGQTGHGSRDVNNVCANVKHYFPLLSIFFSRSPYQRRFWCGSASAIAAPCPIDLRPLASLAAEQGSLVAATVVQYLDKANGSLHWLELSCQTSSRYVQSRFSHPRSAGGVARAPALVWTRFVRVVRRPSGLGPRLWRLPHVRTGTGRQHRFRPGSWHVLARHHGTLTPQMASRVRCFTAGDGGNPARFVVGSHPADRPGHGLPPALIGLQPPLAALRPRLDRRSGSCPSVSCRSVSRATRRALRHRTLVAWKR